MFNLFFERYCLKIIISLSFVNFVFTEKLPISIKNGINGLEKLGRAYNVEIATLNIWLENEYWNSKILMIWDSQINPIKIKRIIKKYLK